jgi:2-amino-4-hydroxy-6-hydroxymethyldihydropteridine diphosphokinase
MQYYEVYLLFGSNMGDRVANIENAVTHLEKSGILPIKLSSWYQTEPWGNREQAKFINRAGQFRAKVSPGELMRLILKTEHEMGRRRTKKWEPRIIDVDILLFADRIIVQKNLQVPHPEMEKRKFALVPLSEIAPGLLHPSLKKNIKQLLAECVDTMSVELFRP